MKFSAGAAADWSEQHEQQMRVGVVHAMINTAAAGLYGASLLARTSGTGRALRYAGLVTAAVGGLLGGHISFRQAGGANHAEAVASRRARLARTLRTRGAPRRPPGTCAARRGPALGRTAGDGRPCARRPMQPSVRAPVQTETSATAASPAPGTAASSACPTAASNAARPPRHSRPRNGRTGRRPVGPPARRRLTASRDGPLHRPGRGSDPCSRRRAGCWRRRCRTARSRRVRPPGPSVTAHRSPQRVRRRTYRG